MTPAAASTTIVASPRSTRAPSAAASTTTAKATMTKPHTIVATRGPRRGSAPGAPPVDDGSAPDVVGAAP
ncbi:MAG: hypothetical protein ACTMIZ_12865 [Cellulosimicrobium funkei]